MLDLPSLMHELAQRRPVFHSEADFQHALAWLIHEKHTESELHLEYPLRGLGASGDGNLDARRGAIDIYCRLPMGVIAIELKYFKKKFRTKRDDYDLLSRGAPDQGGYDFWKDVMRLEELFLRKRIDTGAVIVLSNDPVYWSGPRKPDALAHAFSLMEGARSPGRLQWGTGAGPGSMATREAPLEIRGSYALHWRDYSEPEGTGARKFRYLSVPIRM